MSCQHPGKVLLQQYLEPQKISQNALARAIKVPPRRINEIIHEKRGITADTAVRLSIYFGGSAGYWTNLQSAYEIEKVKQNITIQLGTIQTPSPPPVPQIPEITPNKRKSENSVKKRIMR
jgi:addiction module HigA family antidote